MDLSENDTKRFCRDENGFFKCNHCQKQFVTRTVFADHIIKEQSVVETKQVPVKEDNVQEKLTLSKCQHCDF